MPRRRYRLLTVCAVVIVLMLYRVVQNLWDEPPYTALRQPAAPKVGVLPPQDDAGQVVERPPPAPEIVAGSIDPRPKEEPIAKYPEDAPEPKGEEVKEQGDSQTPSIDGKEEVNIQVPTLKDHEEAGNGSPSESIMAPGGGTEPVGTDDTNKFNEDTDGPLFSKDPPKDRLSPSSGPKVHWEKMPEDFPVSPESIITLPTGTPKAFPKIQYGFGIEPEKSKTERLERLNRVKAEIERAWSGYKKYAWMHDEVRPVSGKFKDPFCGWAATLVDSLDTLWIAGLKDEFKEAAKAVKDIDFTYTPRNDIPVFETTIRYLGGLLAAFDVSGGHTGSYPMLLDKAVELAEILMGTFDTPNRLPVLYYQWKPQYASQPHMAGRAGMAELGTLSLEFTRLAQLTGQQKYYDAVARITNALAELQEAGTAIPGLFPEILDASGCNRSTTTQHENLSQAAQDQLDTTELQVEPQGWTGLAQSTGTTGIDANGEKIDDRLERRSDDSSLSHGDFDGQATPEDTPVTKPKVPLAANGKTATWDCTPQGLVPTNKGHQKYHMAGAQDSAYEYFAKEDLLLGGREPKYQKLYEDTIEAVNEWLLYRPMTDDNWDILFPAKVTTAGNPKKDLDPIFEIAHLTCFIGGMYGLGGKMYGREDDVKKAKQLTDGCVWAYQATRSGIMPEGAILHPCPTLEKCEFNTTAWWDAIDPYKDQREGNIAKWEQRQEEIRQKELRGDGQHSDNAVLVDPSSSTVEAVHRSEDDSLPLTKRGTIPVAGFEEENAGSELPDSLKDKLGIETPSRDTKDRVLEESKDETVRAQESKPSIPHQTNPQRTNGQFTMIDEKPPTHEEFVSQVITKEGLYPGFVEVKTPSYILRPEAIESVWYMYRITGDPTWMDKGWTMFEAIVRATRSEFANSAIDNVLVKEPKLKDSMESFWIAETLKYFYLLFSEPDVISLDDWVLNTEAHPFKRPTA